MAASVEAKPSQGFSPTPPLPMLTPGSVMTPYFIDPRRFDGFNLCGVHLRSAVRSLPASARGVVLYSLFEIRHGIRSILTFDADFDHWPA